MNTEINNAKDAGGTTWKEFATLLFEFEYCAECGGDVQDHEPCIGPFGLWFARCKRDPQDIEMTALISTVDPFQNASPCWDHPQSNIGTMTRLYGN